MLLILIFIYLGSIIREQFSRWQLSRGNYQQSIIMRGNSLSVNCPRTNYFGGNYRGGIFLGDDYPGGNYPGWNCPGGNYPGGSIILGDNCPGGAIVLGGNYPGEQLSGGQLSSSRFRQTCYVVIVIFWQTPLLMVL